MRRARDAARAGDRAENTTFSPQFEVVVWRGSLQNPKKRIVPFGSPTITFCSLKDNRVDNKLVTKHLEMNNPFAARDFWIVVD